MQPDPFAAPDWRKALNALRDAGTLRDLDLAVAEFLAEQQPDADPPVLLLAALTSAQLAAGHLCLDLREPSLIQRLWPAGPPPDVAALLPGDPRAWRTPLATSALVDQTGHGNAPLVLEDQRLYLRRHWAQETAVARELHTRLAAPHASPDDLPKRLSALFGNAGDDPDWQQVACALAARGGLTLITGGPGTGKTTTVVKLLGLLQSLAFEEGRRLRIRLAAPTGKAAARLTESIGDQVAQLKLTPSVNAAIPTEVATLHRLLGTRRDSRHFRHHRHNPLHADLVVVDEASMIDMDMMAALLDALGPQTRLILLGDKDQLASVEAGAVMGDLCRHADAARYDAVTLDYLRQNCDVDLSEYAGDGGALAQQTAMLRKNWRFQDAPGIGQLADAINAGDDKAVSRVFDAGHAALRRVPPGERRDLAALMLDGEDGLRNLFHTVRTPPASTDSLDRWAREKLHRLGRRQLLSGLRNGPFGVDQINRDLTERLRRENLADEHDWYPGRPVMLTRNDYQLGLMNGDVGLTLAHPDGLRVAFALPGGQVRWVLPSRLDSVETVYAMTVHKSQGSEFRHALLVLPDHAHPLLTRELIYTAVTRARETFTLIEYGAPPVLARAVRQRTWRASGLWEKLRPPG